MLGIGLNVALREQTSRPSCATARARSASSPRQSSRPSRGCCSRSSGGCPPIRPPCSGGAGSRRAAGPSGQLGRRSGDRRRGRRDGRLIVATRDGRVALDAGEVHSTSGSERGVVPVADHEAVVVPVEAEDGLAAAGVAGDTRASSRPRRGRAWWDCPSGRTSSDSGAASAGTPWRRAERSPGRRRRWWCASAPESPWRTAQHLGGLRAGVDLEPARDGMRLVLPELRVRGGGAMRQPAPGRPIPPERRRRRWCECDS